MKASPLLSDHSMPLVPEVTGERSAQAAARWAQENAGLIKALAGRAGVVLIRGFEIATPEEFRALCQAIEPHLRNYVGGDSPRSAFADQVYSSTEYDAEFEVFLHNELSYAGWSPRLLFFGCLVPAREGGETQIADGREIYRALPAAIRERFERRGIVYLQHLWNREGEPGVGKSWQETFETGDRAEVEAYLSQSGMRWDWTGYGLRTRAPHAAIVTHPLTGETCWFNQADQWHRGLQSVKTSFGPQDDPRFDPATAGEKTLGNHVTYGDGGEIDVEDLKTVRRVNRAAEVLFPWQAGDVMVIDNLLAMHGSVKPN